MSDIQFNHMEQPNYHFQANQEGYGGQYYGGHEGNQPYYYYDQQAYFTPMHNQTPTTMIGQRYEYPENGPSSSESSHSYDSFDQTIPSQRKYSSPQEPTLWPEREEAFSSEISMGKSKKEKQVGVNGKRVYKKKTFRPIKCIQVGFLSGLAFLNSGRDGCSLRELYAFVVENFEGFEIHVEAWKKSIRHSLCTHDDVYMKAEGDGNWMFKNKDLFLEKLHKYVTKHPDPKTYGLKDPRNWNAIRYGTKGIPHVLSPAEKQARKRKVAEETVVAKRQAILEQPCYYPENQVNWEQAYEQVAEQYAVEQYYVPQMYNGFMYYPHNYQIPNFTENVFQSEQSTPAFNVEELIQGEYCFNPTKDFNLPAEEQAVPTVAEENSQIVPFEGL